MMDLKRYEFTIDFEGTPDHSDRESLENAAFGIHEALGAGCNFKEDGEVRFDVDGTKGMASWRRVEI